MPCAVARKGACVRLTHRAAGGVVGSAEESAGSGSSRAAAARAGCKSSSDAKSVMRTAALRTGRYAVYKAAHQTYARNVAPVVVA